MRFLLFFLLGVASGLFAQQATPVSSPPTAAGVNYHPSTLLGLGGGAVIPNGGAFGYEQVSIYAGSGTYVTQVNQFSRIGGQLQSCAMAGATKVQYQPGAFSFGLTGLAGACQTTQGNASGAVSAQPFVSWHIKQSPFSLALTGEKTFTASGKTAGQVTLGLVLAVKP